MEIGEKFEIFKLNIFHAINIQLNEPIEELDLTIKWVALIPVKEFPDPDDDMFDWLFVDEYLIDWYHEHVDKIAKTGQKLVPIKSRDVHEIFRDPKKFEKKKILLQELMWADYWEALLKLYERWRQELIQAYKDAQENWEGWEKANEKQSHYDFQTSNEQHFLEAKLERSIRHFARKYSPSFKWYLTNSPKFVDSDQFYSLTKFSSQNIYKKFNVVNLIGRVSRLHRENEGSSPSPPIIYKRNVVFQV